MDAQALLPGPIYRVSLTMFDVCVHFGYQAVWEALMAACVGCHIWATFVLDRCPT